MRIVFTGGGGLIGRAVVHRLADEGHQIVSLVRRPTPGGVPEGVIELIGDAADRNLVASTVAQPTDAIVHFAAIPSPGDLTAVELVTANTLTTMTVLEESGRAGVPIAIIASSVSVLGMAWSEELMSPIMLPVDEDHVLRPSEGYGLSKEMDEAAARFAGRRWGTTVIAMRFPFTGTRSMLVDRGQSARMDEGTQRSLAKELWAYLDVRDAATAVVRALDAASAGDVTGAVVLNIMADDVLSERPVRELAAEWHPSTPISEEIGRGAYSTHRARTLIGFEAEHLLDVGATIDRLEGSEESHE